MQEVAFTALSLLFLLACTAHMVSAQEEFIELTDMEKRSLMGQSNPSEYFMNAVRSAASPHQTALEDWLTKFLSRPQELSDPESVRKQILSRKLWK
uniref:Uncharacterized protein n=1 Tax=Plectus sambesii TaxID=2011161 RepID=A0A914VAR6_9BILA